MRFTNYFTGTLAAAAMLLVGGGCIADDTLPPGGDGTRTVTLSIHVPAARPATRALTARDESRVEEVDVLQFGPDGKYLRYSAGTMVDLDDDSGETRFSTTLLEGEDYDIVVVANARAVVADAVNSAVYEQTGIRDMLDGLKITLGAGDPLTSTPGDKIASGEALPLLPMFGIVREQDIWATGANIMIKMLRSTAKIEVELTDEASKGTVADGVPEPAANSNFELVEVRLYNQPLEGWVAPDVDDWDDWLADDEVAKSPFYGAKSAPAKASYPTHSPLVYTGSDDNVGKSEVLRSIYTFEAPAGSEATRDTNTCLVVGGKYKGSSDVSYYRVDIRNKADDTYLALLRNHNYTVRILSVEGPGRATPDDAFNGTPRLDADKAGHKNTAILPSSISVSRADM